MAEEAAVEVEKVDWRRLVWLLSRPCNSLDGHKIVFISAHFRLTELVIGVVGSDINVSLRINWLHDCFITNGVKGPPPFGPKRRELSCDFDSKVVPIVLQAIPSCPKLTHARFSFCGYEPIAVERLLFLLCERLRFTPTLFSLNIDITFPLRNPKRHNVRSVKDDSEYVTIREFSPILLVRNPSLKTLVIHSDSHTFDCVAAEHIALFIRENTALKFLDLRLLVTSPEFLLHDVWHLIRPLSNGDRFGHPLHDVVNKTLRKLVLKFFFWKTDWPLHLAIHVQGSDALVKSSFLMCPFLHKLSLSLVSRSIDDETEDNLTLSFVKQKVHETVNLSLSLLSKNVVDGSEAVHVTAETRCWAGHRELHILKCDERESVSSELDEIGVLNLDTLVWTTLRCANADVLVLQNPSPAAVPHYVQFFQDSFRGQVSTIKLSSTAEDEDLALQRARLGAVVGSILKHSGSRLHVEMTHRGMSLISAGKNSVDMWRLLRYLRGLACLESFIVDKWELRRIDGMLRPLFNGAVVCNKSDTVTAVYEVKIKMSNR